jgi:uncharacterized protein DUF4838
MRSKITVNSSIIFVILLYSTSLLVSCTNIKESVSAETFDIVKNQHPAAMFVLPPSPPQIYCGIWEKKPLTENSFNFFNHELERVTKCVIPVVKTTGDELNKITFDFLDVNDLANEDNFTISFPSPNVMKIKCTPRSFHWALKHLLHKYAGVRYLFAGQNNAGTFYPKKTTISVLRETEHVAPSMPLNRWYWYTNGDWIYNNNGKYGLQYSHLITKFVYPKTKYAKEFSGKPDSWPKAIWPLHNGKREKPINRHKYQSNWQPCWSSQEGIRIAIKNICEYFTAHPETRSISLGINDGGGMCQCSDCLKDSRGRNSTHQIDYSNSYYQWCNQIVAGVCKTFPHKYFGVLAYREVIDPPDFKLHPNMVPVLCIDIYALTDPVVKAKRFKLIEDWTEKAHQIGLWEYQEAVSPWSIPRIFFKVQDEAFDFLIKHNCKAFYAQVMPLFGTDPVKYIYLRKTWNATLDTNKLLDEWYTLSVGKDAAPFLKQYYQFWENLWAGKEIRKTPWFGSKKATYMAIGYGNYIYALQPGDIAHCRKLMEQVVAKAGTAREKARALLFLNMFEFYEANAYTAIAELIPETLQAKNIKNALKIIRAIPKACSYQAKIKGIMTELTASENEKIRQMYSRYTQNASLLTNGIFNAITPYIADSTVRKELEQIANNPTVSPSLRAEARIFIKLDNPGSLVNLLQNGSFESPEINFSLIGGNHARATDRSTDYTYNGKYSLKIPQTKPRTVVYNWQDNKNLKRINIVQGKAHILMARIFLPAGTDPGEESYVRIGANLSDGKNHLTSMKPAHIKLKPGKWVLVRSYLDKNKRANCASIFIDMNRFENNVNIYIDDIILTPAEDVSQAKVETVIRQNQGR